MVPGVESAGLVNRLPLGGQMQPGVVRFEGKEGRFDTDWRSVSAGYFRTMSVPLRAGRTFDENDSPAGRAAGIIDERLAREVFGAESPLGRRFRMDVADSPWVEIVGVVGYLRQEGLDQDARPQVYWPYQQRTQDRMAMVIRSSSDFSSLAAAVRTAIHEVDAEQPLYDVRPMTEVVERTLHGQWLNTVLMGIFAGMALLLASVGLYGVISYLTARRQREFGIRVAVGARAADVGLMVLKEAVLRAAIGLGAGLVLAAGLTWALGAMLFGVSPLDWKTYGAVAGLLTAVMAAASLVPAWRASRADPTIAIRQD
jgi:predicted permease